MRASPARRPANSVEARNSAGGGGTLAPFAATGTPCRISLSNFLLRRACRRWRGLGADAAVGDRGRRETVPAAGGHLDLGRGFRLRLGGPDLRRGARRHQRLLVEAAADVVALLAGVLVAIAGGQDEPLVGFRQVGLHADAARIKDCEVVLAVDDAVIGGLAEPFGRGLVIRLAVDALGVEDREIVHGLGVAGLGRRQVEAARGFEVFLDAQAFLVERAEAELGRGEALLGGALEPFRRLGQVLRHAASIGIALCDLVFGGGVALGGGRAQAGADRGRHLVGAGGRLRGFRRGRANRGIRRPDGAGDHGLGGRRCFRALRRGGARPGGLARHDDPGGRRRERTAAGAGEHQQLAARRGGRAALPAAWWRWSRSWSAPRRCRAARVAALRRRGARRCRRNRASSS